MARSKKSDQVSSSRTGVIYARYSSHNQKEESIEQQVEECMSFAAMNGIKIIHVYADKAISGRTDKRPQFQHLMRDAEKREFSVVVAYKSNRIARDMLNALKYEDKLGKYGIETMYAKEEFGNTAAGRFALRTMMNVNQFYSENMAEDIRRGMLDNAENCKVNGALPLGYVSGSDGRYAIDPEEAAIVQEIYDRVLDGVSFTEIANDLNGRGIRTKHGGLWNKNSFHRLLTNDVYIGVYRHSGVVKEGGVPPILEREVFIAMQKHLETKKNPRGRHRENGEYLLTGKLHCGECESFMIGVSGTSKTGARHYYYTCNGRRTGSSCKKENVRRDYIEYTVAAITQQIVFKDDIIDWIATEAVELAKESNGQDQIEALEQELAENHKATKNIMSAIEQGIITATTKNRLLELEADSAALEQAIQKAKAISKGKLIDKDRVVYFLTSLREGNLKDKTYQKRLIDTFVRAVYLWDDRICIDYYYAGSNSTVKYSLAEIASEAGENIQEVLKNSPGVHHTRIIRTQDGQDVTIVLTVRGFALFSALPVFG